MSIWVKAHAILVPKTQRNKTSNATICTPNAISSTELLKFVRSVVIVILLVTLTCVDRSRKPLYMVFSMVVDWLIIVIERASLIIRIEKGLSKSGN